MADRFEYPMKKARSSVEALERQGPGSGARSLPPPAEAIEELHTALEELQVAEEEMQQQNEELLAAREALEQERQRYRDLFEFAPNGYLVTDPAGIIREANRVASMLLQVPARFLVGRPILSFVTPEGKAAFRTELNGLRAAERLGEWEAHLQPREGAPLDVALSVAVVRGAEGEPVSLRWMVRDITERKRVEGQIQRLNTELERRVNDRTAELQAANEMKDWLLAREQRAREEAEGARQWLAFLADASATLATSLDYQATLENVAQLAIPRLADHCLVDIQEEDAPGGEPARHGAAAHREPADGALFQQQREREPTGADWPPGVAEVLRTGQTLLVTENANDERAPASDAEGRPQASKELGLHAYLIVPLIARGRTLGALSFLSRSAERRYGPLERSMAEALACRGALAIDNARLYRELQTANRRKDDFLAMLAHELRNPLSPILNALHLLRLRGPDTQVLDRVRDVVERQVRHMAHLIEDLLNVTRIARGKISLRRERLDLAALVRETTEDHRAALETAGLTLVLDLPATPVSVVGDATRLAQVVGNLLQNAIKFTGAGGQITVRLAPIAEDHVIGLTIRDTGIGMEPELVRHVFDTFIQADVSLDRSQGGLGLGLALVRGLVELHGGEVRAYSEGLGRGAEFTVYLPLPEFPRPLLDLQPAVPALPHAVPSESPRVLVVEDNRDAAETLRDLLESWEYVTDVAHTGTAAVERARQFRPAIVLCDLGLPGMDGYAVAAALRKDPVTASVCLIAVTGYGDDEDRRRAQAAGFDLHLTKPVDPTRLQHLLAEIQRE